MKIISINATNTKSDRDVAFNVDAPPAAGVMEKISYGHLSIRFEDGLLFAQARQNDSEIDKVVVTNLSEKIAEAERLVAAEVSTQTRRHAAMLQTLSHSTGLPVQ